jgi:outer membrane protein assembly factor BamB
MFKSKSQCNTLVNLVSWNGDKMFRFFVTGIVLIAIARFSFGEALNWPTWRGPQSNGIAPKNAAPPIRWSEKNNIKWKVELPGKGSSSPIIWGDDIFLTTAIKTDRIAKKNEQPKRNENFEAKTVPTANFYRFEVLCFDKNTGKLKWNKIANEAFPHEGHHSTHSYAAGSCVTDGKRLYTSFGSFGFYCFDLSGNLLWQRDFGRLTTRLGWGEAVTPSLFNDSLVLNLDQEINSKIVVLDCNTGKTKWEKDRDEKTTWNTPLIVTHLNKTQVILNGTNRVRSYNLADGSLIWETSGMTTNAIPSPISANGMAYVMSGYRGAAAIAIPLNSTGVLDTAEKVAWQYAKGTPYVPSPIINEDMLYFTKANTGILTALDLKTGKPIFEEFRLENTSTLYASPVIANGMIYFMDRDGTTVVIKTGRKPEIIATNRLNESIDASPAISGKTMFIRGEKHLFAIEE